MYILYLSTDKPTESSRLAEKPELFQPMV